MHCQRASFLRRGIQGVEGVVRGGRSYRIAALLGEGAFGCVYLANTVGAGLDRRVAVKLLRPEKVSTPGLLGRLRDEARMLAAIRHRAIVRVDDLMELDGSWAIVMEYVEGCDITELLRHGAIPPLVALAMVEEVAGALHAAYHQRGPDGKPLHLIHRDIKPSNIRVTAQGEVKILDFGVARAEFEGREEHTQEAAFGTVPYMAPERFYGDDTHAGDVYALGVTLFEMLTTVKPGKTAMDADRVPPGSGLRAQWSWLEAISPALHDLIASMMAAEAENRPTARETAKQIAAIRQVFPGETLDEWSERVVPDALRFQVEQRALQPGDRSGTLLIERSGALRIPSTARSAGWKRWHVALAALLMAGVVAALVIVPVLLFGSGKPVDIPVLPEKRAVLSPAAALPTSPSNPVAVSPVAKAKPRVTATVPAAAPRAVAVTPPPAAELPLDLAVPGSLMLKGDAASVSFTGPSGQVSPGSVAAGTYTATVSFGPGRTASYTVVVPSGGTTTLDCKSTFGNCRVE